MFPLTVPSKKRQNIPRQPSFHEELCSYYITVLGFTVALARKRADIRIRMMKKAQKSAHVF